MLKTLHIAVVALMVGAVAPRPLAAQTVYTCGSPNGATPEAMLGGLKQRVSGTDATDSLWRASVNLPRTAASNVTFVAVDSICDAAARAVSALSSPAAPVARVWVIAVDSTRYVVFGAPRKENEYALSAVFDINFTWLADF